MTVKPYSQAVVRPRPCIEIIGFDPRVTANHNQTLVRR
jgi:hypothetical protein